MVWVWVWGVAEPGAAYGAESRLATLAAELAARHPDQVPTQVAIAYLGRAYWSGVDFGVTSRDEGEGRVERAAASARAVRHLRDAAAPRRAAGDTE